MSQQVPPHSTQGSHVQQDSNSAEEQLDTTHTAESAADLVLEQRAKAAAAAATRKRARPAEEACSKCGKPARYKCPACACMTCSVECVRKHKEDSGCSGKRPRSVFAPLREFDESMLLRDYHFLEDVARTNDAAHRGLKGIGTMKVPIRGRGRGRGRGGRGRGGKAFGLPHLPRHVHLLLRAAKERDVSLKLMPLGMQRRMDNTSRYDTGTQVLSWRVQWSVHVGGSSAALQLTSAAVPETHSILDAVTEALGEASGSAGEAPLEQLAAAKAALSEDPPIAAFYLEHPYRVKGERQWLPVQGGTALAAAVKGATIVEFPHIAVDCTGSGCYALYTPPPPPPPAPAPGPGQSHAATSGAQAATVSAGTAGAPFPGAGVAPVYSTGHGAGSTHSLASFTQAARSAAAAGAVSGPHRAGGAAEVDAEVPPGEEDA